MTRICQNLPAMLVVALVAASPLLQAQQREHADIPRDQWQRVPDVLAALGAAPGSHVADVGAGQGWFTTRIAKAVGSSGRVYAVDVNPIGLRELKQALGSDYPNVEVVKGEEDNPRLPAGRLDAILVVNAYHEFAEYRAMLSHLRAALRAGGRLVLIEPIPREADATRAAQTSRHSIAFELAEADLREAGFEIVQSDRAFVSRPAHQSPAGETPAAPAPTDWLLVARKPAT